MLPPAKSEGRARAVRGPRPTALHWRLWACANLIHRAESDLGPLSPGQRSDLLLDNFEWILDSTESHELVKLLEAA